MNNPRPLMSIRKTVQLMVILTILAWATQTLFAQWGYGGLILPERTPSTPKSSSFGPAPAAAPHPTPAAAPALLDRFNGGAMIELQSSARFAGEGKITLRDICKWSDQDAAVLEPLGDTFIAKIGAAPRVRQVTVDDVKSRLHDAGANLSLLQFTGSARCAILIGDMKESDIPVEIEPETPAIPAIATAAPAEQPQQPAQVEQPVAEEPAAPTYFQEQLVLTRPLSRNQRIIASDIMVKRVQIDAPSTQPAMTQAAIIGNLAARDLKAGEVFDAADIARPAAVTKGQFMTVALRVRQYDVETVARAMDSAAAGEIVRAKNEANGDVYRVVITAANEGRAVENANDESDKQDDIAAVPQN